MKTEVFYTNQVTATSETPARAAGRQATVLQEKSTNALTPQDLNQVKEILRSLRWSEVITPLREMEKAVAIAREVLGAAMAAPEGTRWMRAKAWVASTVGRSVLGWWGDPRVEAWVVSSSAASVTRAQQGLSQTVTKLRQGSNKLTTPITNMIQRDYHGRTFDRTEHTPRALVLASVPSDLTHLNHDFAHLKREVKKLVKKSGEKITAINGLGDDRIAVSRKGPDGKPETMELAFRRPGKVTVFINGRELGGTWNGLAAQAVEEFAKGKNCRAEKTTYKNYTVKEPEGGASVVFPKKTPDEVVGLVGLLAKADNRPPGISLIQQLGGKVVVSRRSKSGTVQTLEMTACEGGKIAISVNGTPRGTCLPDTAYTAALAFINRQPVRTRATTQAV